jgi:hypothetical protein
LPFDLSCCGFFPLGNEDDLQVAYFTLAADGTENTIFVSCYDPVEKCPISVSMINQVTASAHAFVTLVFNFSTTYTLL